MDSVKELYVSKVIVSGEKVNVKGREYRRVGRWLAVKDVPGFVDVVCLVRLPRNQDSAHFFLFMDEKQWERLASNYPERVFCFVEDKVVAKLTWEEYKTLIELE